MVVRYALASVFCSVMWLRFFGDPPGKPVAHNCGLLSVSCGLLRGYSGLCVELLGFAGARSQEESA